MRRQKLPRWYRERCDHDWVETRDLGDRYATLWCTKCPARKLARYLEVR